MPANIKDKVKLFQGGVYVGDSFGNPAIGDVRIKFKFAPAGLVLIVSQQNGKTFSPYVASNGHKFNILVKGI